MTVAGPSSFPPSRILALRWQDLAGHSPHRLWFSTLLCHRIEALVEIASSRPLDPLQTMLLRGLAVLHTLPLDRALFKLGMSELVRHGLLEAAGTGWTMTPAGQQALDTGRALTRRQQRCSFSFVDNSAYQRPPHFLYLPQDVFVRASAPAGWQFEPGFLLAAIQQAPAWKQLYQFPEAVLAVVPAREDDWRSVMVDFPEQATLALVQVATERGPALRGFGIRPSNWALQSTVPILSLDEGWNEVFPELAAEPALEAWREEWLRWSQPHGLPAGEAEACRLQRVGHRVVIQAPPRLVARYRTGPRAETLRQEGWLLVGDGRSREVGQIELVEAT
jgi:hypothetical protein